MQRTEKSFIELRKTWRRHWLECLYEFSSPELQQQSWVDGRGKYVSSYTECMCGYFNDLLHGSSYKFALAEGLVSEGEVRTIQSFHEKADVYKEPSYVHEEILFDPGWQEIVSEAQEAWSVLSNIITDPEELRLMQSLEAGFWKEID